MKKNLLTEEQRRNINEERGIAYVVLLIYLTIMTCLGLSFIQKVGLEAKIVMNKTISSQAHYFAETAASHAMWGMLNVPGFAPDGNMYYMHSLANGRYGYKVRKPTETTFATIAAIGVMGENVVEQGYVPYILPSNVFTAYGSSTNALPLYRRMLGADWTDPNDVLIGGANAPLWWVELEGCPIRKELIGGSIDNISEIKAAVYDGTSWGNTMAFGHGDKNYKCFDIAYESQSGDALVVAVDSVGQPPKYNIWDGSGWVFANNQVAFSVPGGNVSLITMASCPGNDDILIAAVHVNKGIRLIHWDGNAFHDQGEIVSSASVNYHGVVQIVYETQSGDALVLYGEDGFSNIRYRVWNGAAISPPENLPGFGSESKVIRAAADPASDHIIAAAVDFYYDINVAVWDGDAWIDSDEIETSTAANTVQCFDVAWEAAGEDAVVIYSHWGATSLRVFPWKKGTTLAESTVVTGSDFLGKPWLVRVLPIAGTEKIVCLVTNDSNELRYCLWTGNNLKGDPAVLLEPSISVINQMFYDLAEANVPRSGGTGSGGNQPPTVEAGPDRTIYLPCDAILNGTVTDDGLPDPPATVTTAWSKTSGPGTVTFGDVSQVDTTAAFSEAGTYVLRLRANDDELQNFDEVTITVETADLLLVVSDAANPTAQDLVRQALIESFGFAVTLIDDDAPQADFDTAAAASDAAYVSEEITSASLGTKLRDATIGVVIEEEKNYDDFGFSSAEMTFTGDSIDIIDNTHYITTPFSPGVIAFAASPQPVGVPTGTLAPGLSTLALRPSSSEGMLDVIDQGGALYGGGTAAGRRVKLPWGGNDFDINSLTADGQTIMKRAIEWGAGLDGGCGGGDICNGLVGYWELDETSGSTVASDSSGNGNNGTLTSMDPSTDWVPGHIEGGLDFDGSNDRITVPHDETLSLTEGMAFTAWANTRNTSGGYKAILAKDFPGNGLSNYWFGISNDELMFGLWAAGGFRVVTTPSSNLQPGTWYHLAATFDPANDIVRLYVNGTEVHSGPFTYEPTTETVDLWIGQSVDGEYWDGQLDEVRIYSRVLGPDEITQLHALTEGGGCGGGSSKVLFVVDDSSSLTVQDNAKKGLMEGWGFAVTPISASATQGEFDTAIGGKDVAYVSDEIVGSELDTKLKEKTIGVVNEEGALHSVFGFSTVRAISTGNPSLNTVSTHYITSPFGGSPIPALFTADQGIGGAAGTIPSGLESIGIWADGPLSSLRGLVVLETGATISGGGTAAGRRVQMPWGGGFDVNALTADGLTILKRSLEWGAASGGGGGSDTDPPTPDPMTWASPPSPAGPISITMTATTATDVNGVMYYFECTAGGGNDSGWIDTPSYVDTGLTPNTTYTYRVKATDKASPPNETGWSTEESATTPTAPDMFVNDITMGFRQSGQNFYGQATIWIKDDGGTDVSGALVTGDWSGAVSQGAMGTTGADGKIFFESPAKKFGGTFTFTVTDVTKSGYVYNPALNVMTSNSITAP